VGYSPADRRGQPIPAAAEQAWGQEAAGLTVVVRAVLALELRLGAGEAALADLTQEVMRRALEGRSRLRAGAPLRPWILGIARHVAADERRRRSREASGEVDVRDPARGADERLELAERLERFERALGRLPERHRRALLLFHQEDLPYREIAEELRVPVATVATWISRARSELLSLLNEDE
jgi:RNA polymerase sigma factor (sigma-70 family)